MLYLTDINKRKIINTTINTILVIVIVYFIFHSTIGPSGIIKLIQTKKDILSNQKKLDLLFKKNAQVSQKIHALTEKTLDKDYLDEEVRYSLGYIGNNETFFNMEEGK